MAQRPRWPSGWGTLLLLGALTLAACSSKSDDTSTGGSGGAGGTGGSPGLTDAQPSPTPDGGDDGPVKPDDGPPAPPPDGGPTQTPPGDGGPTRDGGCLPCPSSNQPACAADVVAKATCSAAGSACCDPGDRFWLCRCVPRADGGPSCTWMNACGM